MARKDEAVCPNCWHAGCDGNCKTAEQRAAEQHSRQAAEVAARLKKGR